MEYTYYPGCSVGATANLYQESIDAVAPELDIQLEELEDWSCCGATAYFSVKEITSIAITSRNLAMAEEFDRDIVTPCSACYLMLNKANHYFHQDPDMRDKISEALKAGGLSYNGTVRPRHLIDVVVNDFGLENYQDIIKRDLSGLKVAPYYGCQIVRPKEGLDDSEKPVMMDRLVEAVGAELVEFEMKTKCCGASLMGTAEKHALRMCRDILQNAVDSGANCMVLLCPLCQMNLDVYQRKVNTLFKTKFNIPVIYFTQLIGLALGKNKKELGLNRLAVKMRPIENVLKGV
jgi:heterodisulfide reductase subunit B